MDTRVGQTCPRVARPGGKSLWLDAIPLTGATMSAIIMHHLAPFVSKFIASPFGDTLQRELASRTADVLVFYLLCLVRRS